MSINVAQKSVQTCMSNCKAQGHVFPPRYTHIRRNLWRTCSSRLKGQTNVLNRGKVPDCSFVVLARVP